MLNTIINWKKSRSKKINLYSVANYSALLFVCFIFMVPLIWSWKAAFLPGSEIFTLDLADFNAPWTLTNFSEGFKTAPFGRFFINSAVIAIVSTIMILFSSISVGYGFAQFNFRGKKLLFSLVIIALVMPFQALMIPLFIGTSRAGLTNTHLGIIIPSGISAFGIFMMRQFLLNIPKELIDAALIDGCSQFAAFRKVVLPISKAPLATLAAVSFLGVWNNYLWPLMVVQELNMFTLPLGLTSFRGSHTTNFGYIFASSFLACIPALIVFLVMRRQIINNYAISGLVQ
jgi:ABC-type glycerol-3-phosphate transport system permease component